jgi:hypothetical protein
MYQLKKLSVESIPMALQMAERYRLLHEAYEAESICLDILEAAPGNQQALITLLLAYTDNFKKSLFPGFTKAEELLPRLSGGHCRLYYQGIIYERRAKAHLDQGSPKCGEIAHDWFKKAMASYEKALATCSPGNEDATLRWNTCARILNENPHIQAAEVTREVEITDGYE